VIDRRQQGDRHRAGPTGPHLTLNFTAVKIICVAIG
jgi:hypothetical protein